MMIRYYILTNRHWIWSLTTRASSCVNARVWCCVVLEVKETEYLRIPCCTANDAHRHYSPGFWRAVTIATSLLFWSAQNLSFSEFEFSVQTNNLARARWGLVVVDLRAKDQYWAYIPPKKPTGKVRLYFYLAFLFILRAFPRFHAIAFHICCLASNSDYSYICLLSYSFSQDRGGKLLCLRIIF